MLALPCEIWRPVIGYEGVYEVSCMGMVRSIDRYTRTSSKKPVNVFFKGKVLRARINKYGYCDIQLQTYGKSKHFAIHKLVANAFIGNRPEGYQINHIDGVKTNNFAGNLEYCTQSQNTKHAYDLGLIKHRAWTKGKFGVESTTAKKIVQYDKDGNKLGEFRGSYEAMRRTGVRYSGISLCCNGKKAMAGGFIRKYE